MNTLINMKNTNKILMINNCFLSSIFLITCPFNKSNVKVELDVRTKEDNVDIDAERTNTITIPIKISGNVDMSKELADLKIHVQAYGVQLYQMQDCLQAMSTAFPEHFPFNTDIK